MSTASAPDLIKLRFTSKSFDPKRKISQTEIQKIEDLLRYSPSSTNVQPWHFVLTDTAEGKSRVARATAGDCEFNRPKVTDAALVVVLCSRNSIDDAYLDQLLAQEAADGRFVDDAYRNEWRRIRAHFVNLHRFEQRDVQHWADKQVYAALGVLLLGVAALGLDATPIEGFHQAVLDEELGLRDRGYVSTVLVAIGHRSSDDREMAQPKSRLPIEAVISRI